MNQPIQPITRTTYGAPIWPDNLHAIHFGVYPIVSPNHEDLGPAVVVGPDDEPFTSTTTEVEIAVPEDLQHAVKGWVSGSWACWGPADQDSDGDDSLHLVFLTNSLDCQRIAFLHMMVRTFCEDTGRVLDYAVITDPNDHSEQTHVATFGGNPWVVIYSGEVWAAGGEDPWLADEEDEPKIENPCSQCGEAEADDWGMCGSCQHDALRSGWVPGN